MPNFNILLPETELSIVRPSILDMLDNEALQKLRRFRNVCRKVLLALSATKNDLKMIMTRINLLNIVPELPDSGPSIQSIYNNRIGFNTVQTSYIMTSKDHKQLKDYIPKDLHQ